MSTPDLSPAARSVLTAIATVQAAGIDATPSELADLAGLLDHELTAAVAELIDAGLIARPEPAERLSLPARVVLLRLVVAVDAIPRSELVAALVDAGVDTAEQTLTGMHDAELIDVYGDDVYAADLGMTLIEDDARIGIVDTDPIRVRLAAAHLRALIATADRRGQTLAEVVLAQAPTAP